MKPIFSIVRHVQVLSRNLFYYTGALRPHKSKVSIISSNVGWIFVFFFTTNIFATCAVAVWTPTVLVLGADSKMEMINPSGAPSPDLSTCKIHRVGRYYVLFSGTSEYRRTGYNAWATIARCVNQTTSVVDATNLAMSEIEREFSNVLVAARRYTSPAYVAGLESNAPIFAIAGFDSGRPYLTRCSYDLVGRQWSWKKQFFPGSEPASIVFTYLCGSKGIAAFKKRHPKWLTEDPSRTVEGMIDAQIGVDRRHDGPPISVVVINQFGPDWKNKKACPDQ